MNEWIIQMFIAAVLGSYAGLLWPILVALYRKQSTQIFSMLEIKIMKANNVLLIIFKIILFFAVGLVIAIIAAAIGFAAFLQDETTRETLKNLGILAYFSAFTYGFSSASLVEEGLKKS